MTKHREPRPVRPPKPLSPPPTKEQRLAIFIENAHHRVTHEYSQRRKPAKKIVSDASSLCEYIMCPAPIMCEAALDLIGSLCFDDESKLAACLRVVEFDTECGIFVLTDFGKQLVDVIMNSEQKDTHMKKELKVKRETLAERQTRYAEEHRIIAEAAQRAGEESLDSVKRLIKATRTVDSKTLNRALTTALEANSELQKGRLRPEVAVRKLKKATKVLRDVDIIHSNESGVELAAKHGLTPGRISQLRGTQKKEPPVEHIWRSQIREYLRDNLKITLERGDFTDPNQRTITLMLEDEEISSLSFNVRQTREYGG